MAFLLNNQSRFSDLKPGDIIVFKSGSCRIVLIGCDGLEPWTEFILNHNILVTDEALNLYNNEIGFLANRVEIFRDGIRIY